MSSPLYSSIDFCFFYIQFLQTLRSGELRVLTCHPPNDKNDKVPFIRRRGGVGAYIDRTVDKISSVIFVIEKIITYNAGLGSLALATVVLLQILFL